MSEILQYGEYKMIRIQPSLSVNWFVSVHMYMHIHNMVSEYNKVRLILQLAISGQNFMFINSAQKDYTQKRQT